MRSSELVKVASGLLHGKERSSLVEERTKRPFIAFKGKNPVASQAIGPFNRNLNQDRVVIILEIIIC